MRGFFASLEIAQDIVYEHCRRGELGGASQHTEGDLWLVETWLKTSVAGLSGHYWYMYCKAWMQMQGCVLLSRIALPIKFVTADSRICHSAHVYIRISPYGHMVLQKPARNTCGNTHTHTHTHCGLRWFWTILIDLCFSLFLCFVKAHGQKRSACRNTKPIPNCRAAAVMHT